MDRLGNKYIDVMDHLGNKYIDVMDGMEYVSLFNISRKICISV